MKRTISLMLALLFLLALAPAVRADVILEPQDSFYNKHQDECRYLNRSYYADGPEGSVTVYRNPESAAEVTKLDNGTEVWISYLYTGSDGIAWGFCEHYGEDHWTGWMPMDHLLLKYDSRSFREEFAARIEDEVGEIGPSGEERIHFWGYPGSDTLWAAIVVDGGYMPQYQQTFTDDAGRNWAYINYYAALRDTWVCLDAPTADYDTLYADHAPQAVTHPTREGTIEEIKPGGISMELVLLAAGAVAAVSGGFLWLTRKKKSHHE